jgi:hypothetical protein
MKNKPLTETQKRLISRLMLWLIILVTIIIVLLTSCAAPQDLFKPNPNDHKVVWCTQDYVYFLNFYDNTKLDSIINYGSELIFVGDVMFCEFRTLGGLR